MKRPLIEACVDSYASAMAASRAGADRLELCAHLVIGGTTPTHALFRQVQRGSGVPINVLIRPRFGDFLYTEPELEEMCEEIAAFRDLGANGVVIGALTPDGELDLAQMRRMMACAGQMEVTLHRAFDVCRDAHEALRTAKELGVDTILTSGQQARCADGAPLLRELVSESGGGLRILIGGGVNADVIRALAPQTGADAFHLSAKAAVPSGMEFRREAVPMGAAGMNEFELWRCDEGAVRAAREALDAVCTARKEN